MPGYTHRITAERRVITKSAIGEDTITWTPAVTFWGSVMPVQGRQFFSAQGSHADVTHTVRCHYRADIDRTMRLRLDTGAVLDLEAVIDVDLRHQTTELQCREPR